MAGGLLSLSLTFIHLLPTTPHLNAPCLRHGQAGGRPGRRDFLPLLNAREGLDLLPLRGPAGADSRLAQRVALGVGVALAAAAAQKEEAAAAHVLDDGAGLLDVCVDLRLFASEKEEDEEGECECARARERRGFF